MQAIANYWDIAVHYISLVEYNKLSLNATQAWNCFAIANEPFSAAKESAIEQLCLQLIDQPILAFHSAGAQANKLHMLFDVTMVRLEIDHGHSEIDICTIGTSDKSLADSFWQCFHTTVLPSDDKPLNLLVVGCDELDYQAQLLNYLERFEQGWLPD